MNFISHHYCSAEPDDKWFNVGNCLPDMLKFTGRRVPKSHRPDILEDLDHPDERIRSVVRGMKHHILSDRFFHSSDYFEDINHRLLQEVARRLLEIPRRDLFCHVLIEIAIDSRLNNEEPHLVRELYRAFEHVDVRFILLELGGVYDIEPIAVCRRVEHFMAHGYLDSYGTPDGIFHVFSRLYDRLFKEDLLACEKAAMEAIDMVFPILGDYRKNLDSVCFSTRAVRRRSKSRDTCS